MLCDQRSALMYSSMNCVFCGTNMQPPAESVRVRCCVRELGAETFTVWRCALSSLGLSNGPQGTGPETWPTGALGEGCFGRLFTPAPFLFHPPPPAYALRGLPVLSGIVPRPKQYRQFSLLPPQTQARLMGTFTGATFQSPADPFRVFHVLRGNFP